MSLLDSLLLDPARLDVWIALRTDGVKGSGTEDDPYDGSTRVTPIISVSSITRSGTTATATANSHGFKNGDRVLITGSTGADAWFYNGTFSISNVTTNTFQYTMWSIPAASATGSITCRLDPYLLDAVMISLPASPPVTVRLGPGVFETKGFSPYVTGGWQPKSGQKVIGSGMEVTILRLVAAPAPNATYWAVGTAGYLDSFEASDFTVDCNLGGQSLLGYTFPPISCAALNVPVSHVRFRRIRAINFGTLTNGLECFVMIPAFANVGTPEALDCVIEDCILEQPAINNYGIITVILMGSFERSTDGYPAFHRACVVRNSVIDCEYKINPVAITQISFSGTTATVTTLLPHGRAVNDWVRIAGALVNGSADNPFNGSFKITSKTSTTFQYTMASTPSAAPTGAMWVDRFSSHFVAISNISKTGTGPYTITVTTATPHFRVPGNNVVVNQALPAAYNGSFEITAVPSPTQLQYVLSSDPGTWTPTGLEFIGLAFQGISIDGGTAAVMEGNRIFNTRIGGPYHDTYSSKDLVVRNNYYRAVVTGPYQNMGGVSTLKPGVSLTHVGLTATFTTQQPHGLVAGQAVRVVGATINGGAPPPTDSYNGFYMIDSVPSLSSFTYTMLVDPGANADGPPNFPAPTFGAVWQEGRLIIENNLIELIGTVTTFGPPVGIEHFLSGPGIGSQYAMRQGVIRGNIIRHVDNVSDPSKTPLPLGIRVVSYQNVIIEDNVIDLVSTVPLQHSGSKNVRVFNNMTSAGNLIQGYDPNTLKKDDELAIEIEDAQLLGL